MLETSKVEGKALTANYVEKTITGKTPKPMASAKIPRSDWDKLARKAKEMGVSTQGLLQEVIKEYLGDHEGLGSEASNLEPKGEPSDASTVIEYCNLNRWEEDLHQLVAEHNNKQNYDTT